VKVPRETVANALLTLLAATQFTPPGAAAPTTFQTVGRNVHTWGNISQADMPALYLIHPGEQVVQNQAYGLPKYALHFEVLIYARADAAPSGVPDSLINAMLDAIDTQMQSTPPGEKQTLGGVVYHAWIEGEILIDSGILDQQIAILIPIKVLTGI
jgi:hypothetical protein